MDQLRFADNDRILQCRCDNGDGVVLMRWSLDGELDDDVASQLGRVLSTHTIDSRGIHAPIDHETRRSLESKADVPASVVTSSQSTASQEMAWRQRLANHCAYAGHRDAALFHLVWVIDHAPKAWRPLLNQSAVLQQQRRHSYAFYNALKRNLDWPDILARLSEAVRRSPNEVFARRYRSRAYIINGDFQSAADDLKVLRQRTNDPSWALDHAVARLAIGDLVAFRDECRWADALLATGIQIEGAEDLIWMCLVDPNPDAHYTSAIALAETWYRETEHTRGVQLWNHDLDVMRNYAAALLRTDRAAEAMPVLQRCVDNGLDVHDIWMLLALGHSQLGNKAETRLWRDKAAQWLEEARREDHWETWKDRVITKTLLQVVPSLTD
jgi:tetratricopeptide (TPR) repeat protein